jgi:hypothetical protein
MESRIVSHCIRERRILDNVLKMNSFRGEALMSAGVRLKRCRKPSFTLVLKRKITFSRIIRTNLRARTKKNLKKKVSAVRQDHMEADEILITDECSESYLDAALNERIARVSHGLDPAG